MNFAAKIKAEPGWQVIMVKIDGSMSFIDVVEWGLTIEKITISNGSGKLSTIINNTRLVPLEPISGEAFTDKPNFLMLIEPNVKYNELNLKLNALKKAQEWRSSETHSSP